MAHPLVAGQSAGKSGQIPFHVVVGPCVVVGCWLLVMEAVVGFVIMFGVVGFVKCAGVVGLVIRAGGAVGFVILAGGAVGRVIC